MDIKDFIFQIQFHLHTNANSQNLYSYLITFFILYLDILEIFK